MLEVKMVGRNWETVGVEQLSHLLLDDRSRLRVPGIEELWPSLSEASAEAVHAVARRIEHESPETFGTYGSLPELCVEIVKVFDTEQPVVSTMDELLESLHEAGQGKWLVASPLANIRPPGSLIALSETVALAPTHVRDGAGAAVEAELEERFGKRLKLGYRYDHDGEHQLFDSRHCATLITVEEGSRDTATHRAQVKAWKLRDIGTHSSDAVLISLGYPSGRNRPAPRGKPLRGAELAPLHVREGLEPIYAAAEIATAALWNRMLAVDFSDGEWEAFLRLTDGETVP